MAYPLHYYDLVLLAIAASLVVGVAVGVATPLSLTATTVLFGLLAAIVVGHALFVNGPVDEVDPEDVPGVSTVAQLVE